MDDVSPKDIGSSHLIEGMDAVAGSPELAPWSASKAAGLNRNYQQNFGEFLVVTDEEEDEADKQEQGEIGANLRQWTRLHHDPAGLLPGLDDPEGAFRRGIVRSRGLLARHQEHQIPIPAKPDNDWVMNVARLLDSSGSDRKELSPNNQVTGQSDETGNTVIDLTKTGVEISLGGTNNGETSYDGSMNSFKSNENSVEKSLSTSQESVFENSFLSVMQENPINFEDNDLSAFFT